MKTDTNEKAKNIAVMVFSNFLFAIAVTGFIRPHGIILGGATGLGLLVSAKDASGNLLGYAIAVTSAEGYDGNIGLSVGITPEGKINSISFTELHETPGKGMLMDEPLFKDQFNGRTVNIFKLLSKGGSTAEDEIDTPTLFDLLGVAT